MEADKVLGQRIVRAICYKHLQENLTSKYGVGLKALFWSLARAKIQHVFDKILGEIRAIKPTAAAYLEATNYQQWTVLYFRGRRFDHLCSNISEIDE
jgi:hypothetical protein